MGAAISIGGERRQCWRTPHHVFEPLNELFAFTLDGAATSDTALLPNWNSDVESADWTGERAWCNPPFRYIGKFLANARRADVAVLLVPIGTLTAAYLHREYPPVVCTRSGRIQYEPPIGMKAPKNPSFGSVLMIYGNCNHELARLPSLGWVPMVVS